MMSSRFRPAKGLKNAHLQSILSSMGPRKLLEPKRAKQLIKTSVEHIITTPQGVKLQGHFSPVENAKGVAIIIHGWEGSAESMYMLSTGQQFLQAGYSVFRLNMRDHGETHHLNKLLFNSTRLEEVTEAVKTICERFGGDHNVLSGFSLGGNFTVRVANQAKSMGINLHQAIAVCPVLHPPTTMDYLNEGFFIYEKYFVKKWKKSLFKKLEHYNHYDYGDRLKSLRTLDEMNKFFVSAYTDFPTRNAYFEAYAIIGDYLKDLAIPTTIISSADDPMIPPHLFSELYPSSFLTIEIEQYGGHCAFIKNWKFESWISERIVEIAELHQLNM